MKDKGKSVKSEQLSSSDLPCKKHPSNLSSVGICAYCLNEKLIELVCLDCGEQRLSSCSCSDLSSYRNSSCTVDVGSVGRISFLIENEKGTNGDDLKTLFTHMKVKQSETEGVCLLKRSNSCVVEVKKSNGFWRIGKFFQKKKEKEGFSARNRAGFEQGSSAKNSDFSESERRKSGIRGGLMDFKSGFTVKESDFGRIDDDVDDDEFIDLKFDVTHKSKTGLSVLKKYDPLDSVARKAWKGIFKHHSGKNDFNHIFES